MKNFKLKYLEINIRTKQHLAFEFMPYGFGYENPLLIIKLFIISFYLTLPFKIKEKDSDISYGFSFNDYDEKHWFPDYLHLDWGIHTKSYDMPWYPILFDVQYDAKITKGNIHLKDSSSHQQIYKYDTQIKLKNGDIIGVKYFREIRILKCKIFNRFIEYGKKIIYILEIEYDKPNTDLSERGLITDMMFLNEDETVHEAFERYCKERNLNII